MKDGDTRQKATRRTPVPVALMAVNAHINCNVCN